ncbi:ribonuclease Y [Candidatus Dojkabacteria bacterium HGW-Dojkabacteria-1]|uniref:Ribonuclease Y n=1 Tax=Candidatus Dojkabacteria bacterium HGW-Dojkabacteria-1 TaxID=2013761 RepID=A0A2N2F348_9BACT|nr:MAG: ribonuclease Y [Candidatus Dojkabacteria bacterium HGW-Dojkabacteria-1]
MDFIIGLIATLLGSALAFSYIKFVKKWVDIKNIPEEEVARVADKIIGDKIEKAEKEIEENKKRSEDRLREMRKETQEHEELLIDREKKLNERTKMLDQKSEELEVSTESVKKMQRGLEKTRAQLKEELERISGLTQEEARQKLMSQVDEDIKNYEAKKIRQAEKKVEEIAEEKAREILVESMQRIATDYVGETTTSTIKIEDDKVKGRVIGKEGRNIRAFEKLTGVDVIVDESPNTIALSSFDPLRREIASVALTKLIGDGRIHPGSIEEAIRKAKNEISIEIKKNGQILAEEADWPGIDIGLLKLIGKMKYRTSYGQSLMSHTIEMMRMGEVLAAEVGADVSLVKRACLLHDVGKVLTHKIESPHHHISGQVARKYGLDEKLVNAIESHHLDIEPQSVEAVLVYIADAISGARPGARKDSYEQYIQRIESLENVAKELGGDKIEEVFAIKAGRELRIIVKPALISDDEMTVLAKDIASSIEKTQNYPGNVEVTLIRETRAVEVAR